MPILAVAHRDQRRANQISLRRMNHGVKGALKRASVSVNFVELTSPEALPLAGVDVSIELAADAANAGLWSVERDTGQLWATSRALTMFGLEPGRAHLADDVLRAVHPNDREQVASFLHGAARTDDRQAIEYRVVGADGELRWYATRGGVPPGEAGAGHPLMGATVDVTDRKRAEEAAAHRQRELEHLSRVATLSELSVALAHELNQSLAIIMSNAEAAQHLLRGPEPDVAEVRAILDASSTPTRAPAR